MKGCIILLCFYKLGGLKEILLPLAVCGVVLYSCHVINSGIVCKRSGVVTF